MRQFQRRRNTRKVLGSPAVLLPLLVIAVLLAYSTWGVYKKSRIIDAAVTESRSKLDSVLARKEAMERGIGLYSTSRGMEQMLRDKFQVAKPGEHVLVIVDDDATMTSATVVATSTRRGLSGFVASFMSSISSLFEKKSK